VDPVVDVLIACFASDLFGLRLVNVAFHGPRQFQSAVIGDARRYLIVLRQLFVELLLNARRGISGDTSWQRRCRRSSLLITLRSVGRHGLLMLIRCSARWALLSNNYGRA